MERTQRDLWWLVALQAALCFSLPCWELSAAWAAPTRWPLGFAAAMAALAAIAVLACHVGPAFLAARRPGALPFARVVLSWAGAGCVERIVTLTSIAGLARPESSGWDGVLAVSPGMRGRSGGAVSRGPGCRSSFR